MSTLKMKKKPAPTYHHGNLANTLKKEALLLIKKSGISGLNLRTLAKRCEVSPTAVYRHYQNKDDLLRVIIEDGLNELHAAMLAVTNNPTRLRNMGIAYIRFAVSNPLQFRLMIDSTIDRSQFPTLLEKHNQTFAIVRSEIASCIKEGTMKGNCESLTYAAWATVHGTAMLLLDNQLPDVKSVADCDKMALEITTIVGRGLSRVD